MKTHPKIIYLATDPGFFLSHRLPMAKAAQNAGLKMVVATDLSEGAPQPLLPGVRFVHIPFDRRSLNPLKVFNSILKIIRLYRQERPVIVHHISMRPILCGSVAVLAAGTPAVVNAFTGLGYVFSDDAVRAKVLRVIISPLLGFLLSGSRRCVLFQNEDDRDALVRRGIVDRGRCSVIKGSGVDPAVFKELPPPSGTYFICVFPARMIGIKGLQTLKDASALLEKDAPHVRIWLCGTPDPGNPGSWTEAQIEQWASESSNVIYKRHCRDMLLIWAEAHAAILPSWGGEGVPKALLEAASCGRAIVTTDVPGCRDVVEHGRNGLLVPPRNARALAGAVAALAADPGRCAAMGVEGPKLIRERRLTADDVTAQTESLYLRLLGCG